MTMKRTMMLRLLLAISEQDEMKKLKQLMLLQSIEVDVTLGRQYHRVKGQSRKRWEETMTTWNRDCALAACQ